MTQFAQLVEAREKVLKDQRPLVAEVERLRVRISEFDDKRSEMEVSLDMSQHALDVC